MQNETVQKTSLYQEHINLNAKMGPFAGFEMPLQYTSVKDEVLAVRNNVGMFDVSHMGEFIVEGPDAIKFVDYLMCNDFAGAGDLKAVYSPLCRENGTTIDDMIAYKLSNNKVLICVNASNMEKDWTWMSKHSKNFSITFTNKTKDYSLIAIQGPKTEEVLKKLNILPENIDIPYYSVREHNYKNAPLILARTGYTGEDGFEIFCDHETAQSLWSSFLKHGVTPCGLVARDVLRLEVCYPLYGHELNDELSPFDAGLNWTVKLNKGNFICKDGLANFKPKYKLLKLTVEKGIPRDHYPVVSDDGKQIGFVTSGTMSVTINKGIALALIERERYQDGTKLFIQIRNNKCEAIISKKAFVTGGHK